MAPKPVTSLLSPAAALTLAEDEDEAELLVEDSEPVGATTLVMVEVPVVVEPDMVPVLVTVAKVVLPEVEPVVVVLASGMDAPAGEAILVEEVVEEDELELSEDELDEVADLVMLNWLLWARMPPLVATRLIW